MNYGDFWDRCSWWDCLSRSLESLFTLLSSSGHIFISQTCWIGFVVHERASRFKYPHICCLCVVFYSLSILYNCLFSCTLTKDCWSFKIQPSPHYDRFFYRLIFKSLSHYSSISSHPIFDCQSRIVAQLLWASAAHYARGIHTQTF